MNDYKPIYTARVEGVELARNRDNPRFVGLFRVCIEPLNLRISGIRVLKNTGNTVGITMPSTPVKGGGFVPNITLPQPINAAVRAAIISEMVALNIIPEPRAPKAAPLVFDPDAEPETEKENEIPLPKSITGDISE